MTSLTSHTVDLPSSKIAIVATHHALYNSPFISALWSVYLRYVESGDRAHLQQLLSAHDPNASIAASPPDIQRLVLTNIMGDDVTALVEEVVMSIKVVSL